MDDLQKSVEKVLQKQEDIEKEVKSIKATSPSSDINRSPRHNDPQTNLSDDPGSTINNLRKDVLSRPFMRLFKYCALEQNVTRKSSARCVFNYSLSHPVFYRCCLIGDFILICILYLILFLFAILLAMRFFGFI